MRDRRKHVRYNLDGTCLIKHSVVVGNVLDISIGGFSCMCMDQGNCQKELTTKINIYCIKKDDICVEDLPIEVLDTGIVIGKFITDLGLRKCRGRFSQPNDSQIAQLRNIITASNK